jgi:hypothetical protein
MWLRYAVEIPYTLALEAFENKDAALARLRFSVTTEAAYNNRPLLLLPRARSKKALVLSRRFAPLFNAAPACLGPDVVLTVQYTAESGFALIAQTLSLVSGATFSASRLEKYGFELFTTYGNRYTRALHRAGSAAAERECERAAARTALRVKSIRNICTCRKCGQLFSRRAPAHKCDARHS